MMYGGGGIKRPMASIQLASASDAADLSLGETATITITGKVVGMDAPREATMFGPGGGKAKMMPGCISIEIEDISVSQGEDD
jgi:hypothetical protein